MPEMPIEGSPRDLCKPETEPVSRHRHGKHFGETV
jgi:hypothetical protein